MTRTTIAPGVYRDRYGYEVRWRDRGVTRSKRFPLDTPLDTLKAWRRTKQAIATSKRAPVGSFVREATRWLAGRKGRPSYKADRAHLRPWIHRFGRASRFEITREGIQGAIRDWQRAGYSARELRHRLRTLKQCLWALDPDEPSSCVGVTLPRIPKARPRSVPDTLVREVALNLRKAEITRRLRDGKTRARYLVLATTGQRPAQLKRATPAAVDLERRIWFVDPAKGDNGAIVYLNDDMHAAWQLFIAADAWGWFDGRSFAKVLRRNGWPAGIRPYNLRHTVGLALSERGVDLGDIQAHLGHTSPATTRIYAPGLLSRLRGASQKLDGRLDPDHYHRFPTTMAKKQKAKKGEKRPQIARARLSQNRDNEAGRSRKSG